MTSNDILTQIQQLQASMNPLLADQGKAPTYFKDELNKAFNYNLPILQQGQQFAKEAYSQPQTLMEQYNGEFGPQPGGLSGAARMGSILSNLGNTFSRVNLTSDLAKQQGAGINDLATNLTNQYNGTIQGMKDKYSTLLPMFQTLKGSEDSAASRAAANKSSGAINFKPLAINEKPAVTTTVNPVVNPVVKGTTDMAGGLSNFLGGIFGGGKSLASQYAVK
jgi:hypothetical protein